MGAGRGASGSVRLMAELTPDIRALLEARNFAHVATVMPDGSPHSVPVWVGTEGDRVLFFTQQGSQKARNLARDPRLAISLVDQANPYRTGRVRGRVVETRTGDEALAAMDKISDRYTGEPFPMRGPHGILFVVEAEKLGLMELPFRHPPMT
jgi:PPOX class probable F420-dependent enzyme